MPRRDSLEAVSVGKHGSSCIADVAEPHDRRGRRRLEIDIDRLPHVVNYELPNVPEDYVHRIGRTARAGQEGEAISLVCVDELKLLRDIERLLKCEIKKEIIPGYEPDPRIKAEPIRQGRSQRPTGRRGGPGKKGRPGPSKNRGGARGRSSGRQRRTG